MERMRKSNTSKTWREILRRRITVEYPNGTNKCRYHTDVVFADRGEKVLGTPYFGRNSLPYNTNTAAHHRVSLLTC